jgi:hypothetical protein
MTTDIAPDRPDASPAALRLLAVIFYTIFAISVSIVAMALFGLFGLALAVSLAWQWARVAAFGRGGHAAAPVRAEPHAPIGPLPTGNAAFDGYRDETLARLEAERADFVAFLDRLRQARDAAEFQRFLDERGGGNAPRA